MDERAIKCVVVGDGMVGKTCLILRYTLGDLRSLGVYIPTVADNYSLKLMAGRIPVVLNLWDTAGQQDYVRLRQLSYPQTDIFITCFAVDNKSSFQNVRDLWVPEVRHFCPNALILLVGNKVDERDVAGQGPLGEQLMISHSDGVHLARKLKADGYVECSAITGEGVKTVFDTAIRLAVTSKKPLRKRACSIM